MVALVGKRGKEGDFLRVESLENEHARLLEVASVVNDVATRYTDLVQPWLQEEAQGKKPQEFTPIQRKLIGGFHVITFDFSAIGGNSGSLRLDPHKVYGGIPVTYGIYHRYDMSRVIGEATNYEWPAAEPLLDVLNYEHEVLKSQRSRGEVTQDYFDHRVKQKEWEFGFIVGNSRSFRGTHPSIIQDELHLRGRLVLEASAIAADPFRNTGTNNDNWLRAVETILGRYDFQHGQHREGVPEFGKHLSYERRELIIPRR